MKDANGKTIPGGSWVGYKNGAFVTWYSSEKQAELAKTYNKIDSYKQLPQGHHRSYGQRI
jgi:hypothetical protein